MPWIQRTAFALLAFAFAGLGLIVWQPSGHATMSERQQTYVLAISSGAGMKLGKSAASMSPEPTLSCDQVFSLGDIKIGSSCISHGREVTVSR